MKVTFQGQLDDLSIHMVPESSGEAVALAQFYQQVRGKGLHMGAPGKVEVCGCVATDFAVGLGEMRIYKPFEAAE